MSSAKVYIVIEDNHRIHCESAKNGIIVTSYPFSGFVLGNPSVKANGKSEEEVLSMIVRILIGQSEGQDRKIVELDLGDHITVSDVMSD